MSYDLLYRDPKQFRKVTLRNMIMVLFSYTFSAAQFYLPLPMVHTIYNCGPLFLLITDYVVNGTKINKQQILGSLCGMLGMLLVIYGDLLAKLINPDYEYESEFEHYQKITLF